MALEKALVFKRKWPDGTVERFYFLRLVSESTTTGRKVVMRGHDRSGDVQTLDPDKFFEEDSGWEYDGGRVYEG